MSIQSRSTPSLLCALVIVGLLAPATSSAIVVYGPQGPPTLDRMAREAERVVIARVLVDPWGVALPETLLAGFKSTRVRTRVALVVERELGPGEIARSGDTLVSYMAGGNYRDTQGNVIGMWVEDEPFSESRCDGRRCLLFLDAAGRHPITRPPVRCYRPIDSFRAIIPIGDDGKVVVPTKGDHTKRMSIDACVRKIKSIRRQR
jgi:hypothetical protein